MMIFFIFQVEEAGPEGLSQQELGQKLGHGKLEARTICRNLTRRGLVVTIMKDIGRQRVTNFVAKKYETVSHGAVQYQVEKERNDQLTGIVTGDTLPEDMLKIELSEQASAEVVDNLIVVKEGSPVKSASSGQHSNRSSPEKDFTPSAAVNISPPVYKQSVLEQRDGAATEISITSGYVLAEDSSPKKLKKGKKTDRKDETKGETYRQLRRRNIIMEAVRQHSVIDDPTKLYKMIQESEIQEGQSAKMDKKSLMRLISKLGKEGQIHNIRCVFQNGDRRKILHFVCEPGIDESNTVIQSAIEQAKLKFNIHTKYTDSLDRIRTKDADFLSDSVTESLAEMSELEETLTAENANTAPKSATVVTSSQRLGRKYGLQPKFVKMRELHLLMFYLIYGYSGEADLEQRNTIEHLRREGLVDDKVAEELTDMTLYTNYVSWKMFIPPLPAHQVDLHICDK